MKEKDYSGYISSVVLLNLPAHSLVTGTIYSCKSKMLFLLSVHIFVTARNYSLTLDLKYNALTLYKV